MRTTRALLFTSQELGEPSTPEEMFHEVDTCDGPETLGEQVYTYLYLLNQIAYLHLRREWWLPALPDISTAYNWHWIMAAMPDYIRDGTPLKVRCPRCDAAPGHWCVNMNNFRYGWSSTTSGINLSPHIERKKRVQ